MSEIDIGDGCINIELFTIALRYIVCVYNSAVTNVNFQFQFPQYGFSHIGFFVVTVFPVIHNVCLFVLAIQCTLRKKMPHIYY